jgi:hypothetical protein
MFFLIKRHVIHTLTMCHWSPLQSAIGEGMTRKDHSDVSNQVFSCLFILHCVVFFFFKKILFLIFLYVDHLIDVILFLFSSMQIMP